jgi:hypothetical protein
MTRAGVPGRDDARGDVAHDHRTHADHGVPPDADAFPDAHARTDEHVVLDDDAPCSPIPTGGRILRASIASATAKRQPTAWLAVCFAS